jgi:hypothetical protein
MTIGRFAPLPRKRKFGATSSNLRVQSTLLPARVGSEITVTGGKRSIDTAKANVELNAIGNHLNPENSMQRTFQPCRVLVLSEAHDVHTGRPFACSLKFYFKLVLQPPVGPSVKINVDSLWIINSLKREFHRLLLPLEGERISAWQISVVFKGRELCAPRATVSEVGMKGGDIVYGSLRNSKNIPHRWLNDKEAGR